MTASPPPAAERFGRLRILWSIARPYLRTLILGLFLALLGTAGGLATPMVTKWVLDTLDLQTSLTGPIIALAVLLVLGTGVWLWQWILLGTLGEKVVLDARLRITHRLLHAAVPAVLRRPVGELVTRVTSDTVLLREAAATSAIGLINGAVMMVGTLILMAVLDLALLGVTVAAIAVVAVLFGVLMPSIAVAKEKAQAEVGTLGALLEGTLSAIRTVKASRGEERQMVAIEEAAQRSAQHSIRAVRREAMAWSIAWSGIQLAIIVILGFGAYRVSQGDLAVSSLIAFLLYAFGLMGPITELTQDVTALQSGIAAAARISEIDQLELEPQAVAVTSAAAGAVRAPEADRPLVEIADLNFTYEPDRGPVLSDVSLQIPRRGHIAIVGPSGAGKTSLFSLLLRFVEPQSGQILIDGQPYTELDPSQIRSRLAYVEQESPVVPGTVRDNVTFTHPEASEEEVRRTLEMVRLTEVIAELPDGLDTPLSSAQISGGQRQRIAVARALLHTPELLLLDEATAQIDALTEAAITDAVHQHARHGAVLTIAHRLSTVIDADQIIVLDQGRIRAQGTHAELLATDTLYAELVAALRIAGASELAELSA